MKCTYCQSEVSDAAVKCPHCQEYLSGDTCQQCRSTIPKGACVCKFCGFKVLKESKKSKKMPHFFMKGELFPTLLFRFRLLPHEVTTDDEKLMFNAPGLFRLWTNSHEIPWNKIAGFSYRSGIVWDKVEIETRGQKPSIIIGLSKANGAKLRETLQSLEI